MNENNAHTKDTALEEMLASAAPEASADYREGLRARLLTALPTEEMRPMIAYRNRTMMRAAAAAAVVLLIAAALLLTPAGRAIAQRLLEWGPFRLLDAPTDAETEPAPDEVFTGETQRFANAAEASDAAGFTVLYPQHIPAGYRAADQAIELTYNQQGQPGSINVLFEGSEILFYSQTPYTPDPEITNWSISASARRRLSRSR
jgi:YD repeat-containing protein